MASAVVTLPFGPEQGYRENVIKHCNAIEKRVDPVQMLSSPAAGQLKVFLGEQSVQEIKSQQDNRGLLSAARMMFDRLKLCQKAGVWTAFHGLIQTDHYERIIDILNQESTLKDDEHMSRIIQIGPSVIEKMFPVAILDHLAKRECLTREDHENITAAANKSEIVGSRMLLEKLRLSKKRRWYEYFLEALIDSGHEQVEQQINTDSFNYVPEAAISNSYSNVGEADNTEVKYSEEDGEREITCNYRQVNLDRPNFAAPNAFSKDVMKSSPFTNLALKVENKTAVDQGETVFDGATGSFKGKDRLFKRPFGDDTNVMGISSDGMQECYKDDGVKRRKPVKLRSYQEELAEAGLEGKNCMIVAPTGSGKTQVALKIIEEHLLASHENRKVAILVNKVVLAEQHSESCKKLLPAGMRTKLITGGNEETVSLGRLLQDSDVFVMTVQILVDALAFDEIPSLSEFTLIVFDECHHTLRKDPYNVVMSAYLDEKLREGGPRRPLPQIIGLTASTGVGKAKDITQAKDHIEKLCANLDVEKICTVKRCLRDLSKVVNIPDVEIHLVGGRREDRFADFIQDWMINIESKIKDHCRHWTKLEDPPRGKRDCLEYKQWISRVVGTVVRRPDSQHYCMACLHFLEICNAALIINQNVRTRDALNHMTEQMQQMNPSTFTQVERELYLFFKSSVANLESICDNPASTNPKLEKMKKLILSVFHNSADSRVIIFAKFRDLAQALQHWMTETPGLSDLNPQKLVGQGAEEDGGMSQSKQGEVRTGFREGSHKVIVATSVAEEGLDIQKCNLVILYDYDTNEISKVQTRGRARAEDSRYVLLVSEGKGIAEKDEVNSMREILMENAVWGLQEEIEDDPGRFVEAIRKIQITCKEERNLARLLERKRVFIDGTFELRCKKCDIVACFNYDIRKFESTHRAVIAEDFCTRASISLHPKPTKYRVAKKGKLWCSKCGFDWGIVACYRSKNLFVVKIVSFVVVDHDGRRSTFKKWSDVRFELDDLRQTDRESLNTVSEIIAAKLAECELKGE